MLLPYVVLASHILFVVFFISIVAKNSLAHWIGKNAIALSFLTSLAAVGGSLFYSEIMGFEPCVLCWWIRVFLFPLVIIFGVALGRPITQNAFSYSVPLALLAAIVSLYFSYASLGGSAILPCTAEGGACSRVYVKAFGYITIPIMSLTVSLFVLLFAWAHKLFKKTPAN